MDDIDRYILANIGAMKQLDIAKATGTTQATISRRIIRLRKQGRLERNRRAADTKDQDIARASTASTLKAPKWSTDLIHNRTELKAARMTALYLYRNQLTGIAKTEIAKALGVSRWTLDKDLASLSRIEIHIETLEKHLGELLERERPLPR